MRHSADRGRHAASRSEIREGLARVQRACPGWLVMWSPWRQTYTAFCATSREGLVLDENEPTDLIQRIVHADLVLSIGRPVTPT